MSHDAMLEAAVDVFRLRAVAARRDSATADVAAAAALWHRRFRAADTSLLLVDIAQRHRLTRIETEVLVALVVAPLGLMEQRVTDVSDLLKVLALPAGQALAALRALSDGGKLFRRGLIHYDDIDDDLVDREVTLSPGILDTILAGNKAPKGWRHLKSEAELYEAIARLTRAMQRASEELHDILRGHPSHGDFHKWRRKQEWLMGQLDDMLDARPAWKLGTVRRELCRGSWTIFLALVGKALCHAPHDDALFTGAGLARLVSKSASAVPYAYRHLKSDGHLIAQGYIQPCGGGAGLVADCTEGVQEIEFELTAKAMERLGLDRRTPFRKQREEDIRLPVTTLEQMALAPRTAEIVGMALDHVRHAGTLMNTWGLRNAFPYGAGVTLLFHGPPGTGKTATAEAMAHALERPILNSL